MFFNSIKENNKLRKEIKRVVFNSNKEINRLRKEINIKGTLNIYLNVTIKTFSNFDFLGLKNLSPGQFLGSYNSLRYNWILKLLVAT